MSADQMTSSTEQTETTATVESTAMDTSIDVATPTVQIDDKPVNSNDEEQQTETENKAGKRRRSTKKVVETGETIANGRPKRNLSKREEPLSESVNSSTSKAKIEQEEEEEEQDDDEDREKNLPVLHDVADVVWVKMGGHPWWPSLVIRDPNDPNRTFTKISGNARPKRLYFVVFFGSTADFAWVSDATIIAYQGVEAFTQYAQEIVDKAITKSQKEQLTERFQLKVTIGRREDWESAVREADDALKQTSEKRLENIEPKIQFYTDKFVASKGQSGRRTKNSVTKPDESTPSVPVQTVQSKYLASLDPADRSLLAEKTFEFKSDDEDSTHEAPALRKTPSVKIKLNKQPSNDSDSNTTPPTKRRLIPKTDSVFGHTTNGSSVSYDPIPTNETSPIKSDSTNLANGSNSSKKRGRPRARQPSETPSVEDIPAPEFSSVTPSVTTKFTTQRKPIVKPQAFMNSSNGQHDIRTGFLSSFEEQEVLDALEQLGPLKTFEEAEQKAKRRFEHILCLNLNRTHVDIPQEWFYTFLFSHPSLIIKNPQWFTDKNSSINTDLLPDFQSSNSLVVLKQQLIVLSKSYRNQLQVCSSSTTNKKRQSNKSKQTTDDEQEEEEEELIN